MTWALRIHPGYDFSGYELLNQRVIRSFVQLQIESREAVTVTDDRRAEKCCESQTIFVDTYSLRMGGSSIRFEASKTWRCPPPFQSRVHVQSG
jgi:hypothetical protein